MSQPTNGQTLTREEARRMFALVVEQQNAHRRSGHVSGIRETSQILEGLVSRYRLYQPEQENTNGHA